MKRKFMMKLGEESLEVLKKVFTLKISPNQHNLSKFLHDNISLFFKWRESTDDSQTIVFQTIRNNLNCNSQPTLRARNRFVTL